MASTGPVRLAVLGLHHETNTFSRRLATLADYEDGGLHAGEDVVGAYLTSQSTVAGFLDPAPGENGSTAVEVAPLLTARVSPRGPVSREAFETIVDRMTGMLRRAGPVHGVLLSIHGACVAEGYPDADADIACRVRDVVGPRVPVGCVPDMHANISPRLVRSVDVAVPYQTNPHVDAKQRAQLCRRLVVDIARTGRRPCLVLEQLPLAVTIVRQDTSHEPFASLLASARAVAAETGALDVSLLQGFPYADVPHMGMSVLAMHDDERTARAAARKVAQQVWERRGELIGNASTVADAVDAIRRHTAPAPLLVLDVGDNIGGGAPGDSTVLLEAVERSRTGGVASVLCDPTAVAELAGRRPGDRVSVVVGARSADSAGRPVRLTGRVVGRHRGRYEERGIAHGGFRFFDAGEMVSVETDRSNAVVLTGKPAQTVTPVQLEVCGLRPREFRAIVCKGVNAPRSGYAAICSDAIVVDTPGVTQNDIRRFAYRRRRRPMYPYELDATYTTPDHATE